MNSHYLDMAEKNLPELFKRDITNAAVVELSSNSEFFMGVGAVRSAQVKNALRDGDTFILDFKEHAVGYFSFTVKHVDKYLDAPVRLRLRFAEVPYELSRDFSTYKPGLCASWLQEETVNIDEEGIYRLPRRYAFRYAEITVLFTPRKVNLSDFTVTAVTSADTDKLKPLYDSSDPLLKQIDRIAANTLKDCMQLSYEDGPKRDRRLWSGDLRLQALTDYYLYNNHRLVRRCLYLFAACEENGKYLPGCVYQSPEVFSDSDVGITDYAMHWCSALCDYYEHTGDTETALDLYPVLFRQISLAISLLDENGELTYFDGWNKFIDWAPELKQNTAVHGVFLYTLEKCAALADALNKKSNCDEWRKLLEKNRAEIYKAYYNGEKGYFCSRKDNFQYSVQSQVWMILGGVTKGEQAISILKAALLSAESLKPVTPFMHHYVLEALVKLGLTDDMVDYIKSYWGGMAAKADTFWEVYVPDNNSFSSYSDVLMNSFCHAWSCSPSYFIRKYCAATDEKRKAKL